MQRLQGGREFPPNPSSEAVDQTAETLDQDEVGADKDSSEKVDEEKEVGEALGEEEGAFSRYLKSSTTANP